MRERSIPRDSLIVLAERVPLNVCADGSGRPRDLFCDVAEGRVFFYRRFARFRNVFVQEHTSDRAARRVFCPVFPAFRGAKEHFLRPKPCGVEGAALPFANVEAFAAVRAAALRATFWRAADAHLVRMLQGAHSSKLLYINYDSVLELSFGKLRCPRQANVRFTFVAASEQVRKKIRHYAHSSPSR